MKCLWSGCHAQLLDSNMIEHLRQHVGTKKESTFDGRCKWHYCYTVKKSRAKLVSHLISHVDIRLYTCDCKKSFKRKSDLTVHTKRCAHSFREAVKILFHGLPIEEDLSRRSSINKI